MIRNKNIQAPAEGELRLDLAGLFGAAAADEKAGGMIMFIVIYIYIYIYAVEFVYV